MDHDPRSEVRKYIDAMVREDKGDQVEEVWKAYKAYKNYESSALKFITPFITPSHPKEDFESMMNDSNLDKDQLRFVQDDLDGVGGKTSKYSKMILANKLFKLGERGLI